MTTCPSSLYKKPSICGSVEFLIDQMKEQVDVDLGPSSSLTFTEKVHKLMIIKLRRQTILKRHLCACARNLNTPHAPLNIKHTNLITADRDIDFLVLLLGVSAPGHEDAFIPEVTGGVFEGPEFGLPAGFLEFALVVVLPGEGEEETFLSGGLLVYTQG